jgi:hypothetical protein
MTLHRQRGRTVEAIDVRSTCRGPLLAILTHLLLLTPLLAFAQDEADEAPPPPPADVAETAGRVVGADGQRGVQSTMSLAALINIAAIIIISGVVYLVAHVAFGPRHPVALSMQTEQARHSRSAVASSACVTALDLVRSIVRHRDPR